jgi:hypothetical protein
MTLYKILLRPVATCASETWTLTNADERALGPFERKILRSVSGADRIKGSQEGDIILNYINYMMRKIWLNT